MHNHPYLDIPAALGISTPATNESTYSMPSGKERLYIGLHARAGKAKMPGLKGQVSLLHALRISRLNRPKIPLVPNHWTEEFG